MANRVVIIGGVAGGASCAVRLRRLDESAEIYLVERGADVSFANCGLPYYVGGVIQERQQLLVVTPERFRDLFRIEVRTRREAVHIDRAAKCVELRNVDSGECDRLAYDFLVLAPGASPIRPPLVGLDLAGIFTIRNLEDIDRVQAWLDKRRPTRAAVVGGGFIGLEMAENLARRNIGVTILEKLDQLMAPLDAEMVTPIYAELQQHGVDVRLGTGAAGFEPGPAESIYVRTDKGEPLVVDMVILAVGVKPDVALARAAGLELGPLGGIKVDDQMRTSDPSIFAVGDAVEVRDIVTGKPALVPLAGPASRQGRIAADVIAGRKTRFRGVQATAIVGAFGLTLATTGANEKTLGRAGIAYEKSYTHAGSHAGYYPGAEPIAMKLLFSPSDGRLLGAQAVGRDGVDKRIDVLAMALQQGATVYDLEEAELCYAPQYGSAKDPVNMAGMTAGNVLRGDVAIAHWEKWKQRALAGEVPLTIDVRPLTAVNGTVPGAIAIPLGELRSRLDELPRDREIFVHCNFGIMSYTAARLLRQHGFEKVRNLSGGITSYWRQP